MRLITELYLTQVSNCPKKGRHILAQYDDHSIVVYQAYRPAIGDFAATYGYFGGEFSFDRMSWIKPNFFWMMYRSGWGIQNKPEVVLAIWVKCSAFDEILAAAVHSSYVLELYPNKSAWQKSTKAITSPPTMRPRPSSIWDKIRTTRYSVRVRWSSASCLRQRLDCEHRGHFKLYTKAAAKH